MEGKLEMFQR